MKVTPVKKKFGKYSPGDVFDFPDKPAKVFIKIGKLSQVIDAPALTHASLTYATRMMTAEDSAQVVSSRTQFPQGEAVAPGAIDAPYGYKADGTPRKRPGRTKAS